jgi:hypothetical protein
MSEATGRPRKPAADLAEVATAIGAGRPHSGDRGRPRHEQEDATKSGVQGPQCGCELLVERSPGASSQTLPPEKAGSPLLTKPEVVW